MVIVIPAPDPNADEHFFAAEMTDRQFRSIAHRIVTRDSTVGITKVARFNKPKLSPTCDRDEVGRWLTSGWNTEHILSLSATVLDSAGGAVLQWTFPQAYYAAFAHALAFFQVAGFTERGHASVQRKFASLVLRREYSDSFGFAARGTKRNMVFHGLTPEADPVSTLDFDSSDPGSWDRHIMQFLRSTRRRALDDKKEDLRLKTKAGTLRKSFREEHWEQAAGRLGPTGLLCLLYRKRVKANYKDIDTFTKSGIDPTAIYRALLRIVDDLAFVHEAFVAAALGWSWYQRAATAYLRRCESTQLRERLAIQRRLLGVVAKDVGSVLI